MAKKYKLKPEDKVLLFLFCGEVRTKEEIEKALGDQLSMYRISTYIWQLKVDANAIIRSIRDGKKVIAYQLVNPEQIGIYLKIRGIPVPSKKFTVEKELDYA